MEPGKRDREGRGTIECHPCWGGWSKGSHGKVCSEDPPRLPSIPLEQQEGRAASQRPLWGKILPSLEG